MTTKEKGRSGSESHACGHREAGSAQAESGTLKGSYFPILKGTENEDLGKQNLKYREFPVSGKLREDAKGQR